MGIVTVDSINYIGHWIWCKEKNICKCYSQYDFETFRKPIYLQIILVTPGIIWNLNLKTKTTEVSICGVTNTSIKKGRRHQLLLAFLEGKNHKQSTK